MKPAKQSSKIFFGFLIASFLLWMLVKFSKDYKTTINFNVAFINIPHKVTLLEKEPLQLSFFVSASGFKILWTQIFHKKIKIDLGGLQQKKKSSVFYILPKNQWSTIQNQLINGLQIENFLKDTLFVNVGVLSSKKVALKPKLNINFQIGYNFLGDVTVSPDSVVITGAENQLKKISFLELETLQIDNVNADFSKEVTILLPPKIKDCKLSVKTVTIAADVDKFTEGNLQIPYKVVNLPNNSALTTLSENVTITYTVGLTNFSKVIKNSFTVECDYNLSVQNELSYLVPKLISQPDFVENVKISPTKIDFLIQKK